MALLHERNPLKHALLGGLFFWSGSELKQIITASGWQYEDWLIFSYILLGASAYLFFKAVWQLLFFVIPQAVRYYFVFRPSTRAGSAGWASPEYLKKKFKSRKGYLAGLIKKNLPLFIDFESSLLVLAPAGVGKGVRFVITTLCHNPINMIVPDLKGILAVMTGFLREKLFRHITHYMNPSGNYKNILGESACYNPLQILIDNWSDPKKHEFIFEDADAIAQQLYPEPARGGDDFYWRSGARKFMIFAFIYLVTRKEEDNATLAKSLTLLSDVNQLVLALNRAKDETILCGDLSVHARDLLTKMQDGDPKQIESFREGAVQALSVFRPSGSLAKCTNKCDFRFSDMKKKPKGLLNRKKGMTVDLMADPARINVYKPFLGLMMWCALTEITRAPKGEPVCLLGDEICNFKIVGLPSFLTLLREFGVRIILIVQELEEWANIYGRESLQTLLSQTEAKIIMGVRSHDATRLVSDMLGEETVKTVNYNLSHSFFDNITRTVSETSRKLKTPDEVRRTDKHIVLLRDERPILLDPVGYHEVHPWKNQVGINPLFGKKYKGKTKLRL